MGFSIGGGIGPLRYSYRLGGRGSSGSSESDPAVILAIVAVAAIAGGAWASVEGLTGRWGVTGVVFSVLFIIASFFSIFLNEYVATGFITSWVYLVLAKIKYFNLLMWPESWLNTEFDSLDQFVLFLLVAAAYITTLVLVIALPPSGVYFAMNRLHRGYFANLPETKKTPDEKSDNE